MRDIPLINFFRCTAPATDLDLDRPVRCSQPHTELLVELFELDALWDEYGLVGDVVVSFFFIFHLWILIVIFSHSLIISRERISMSLCRPIYYIS